MIVSSEFPPGPGGIGIHAYQLANQLHFRGWKVVVLATQDHAVPQEIKSFNKQQQFKVIQLNDAKQKRTNKAISRLKEIDKWIKIWNPNIVLSTGRNMVWLTALLDKKHQLHWFAVGHGIEFGERKWWAKLISKFAYNQANGIVCVSQYTQHRMYEMGINPSQSKVIPNGADNDVFEILPIEAVQKFKQKLGLESKFILLTVGNTTERKGQDVVIQALPIVKQQIENVHYVLAGLPTGQEKLSQLARELGVAENVHFLGRVTVEELVMNYNVCDIFLLTSRHTLEGDFEGYGIAVVEAALCAKPAIVTKGSGVEEAILPEKTGLLVYENDPEDTAVAICRLLKDNELRQRMGDQARQYALQEQTWTKRVDEYEQFMLKLIAS